MRRAPCECVCDWERLLNGVYDEGTALLILDHFTQVPPVYIGWQQWRLTVLGWYMPQSPVPLWFALEGQHAVSGPAINFGPEAVCALGGQHWRNLWTFLHKGNAQVHGQWYSNRKLCCTIFSAPHLCCFPKLGGLYEMTHIGLSEILLLVQKHWKNTWDFQGFIAKLSSELVG